MGEGGGGERDHSCFWLIIKSEKVKEQQNKVKLTFQRCKLVPEQLRAQRYGAYSLVRFQPPKVLRLAGLRRQWRVGVGKGEEGGVEEGGRGGGGEGKKSNNLSVVSGFCRVLRCCSDAPQSPKKTQAQKTSPYSTDVIVPLAIVVFPRWTLWCAILGLCGSSGKLNCSVVKL